MKKVYYLIAILCLLNIGDYFSTVLAIKSGASEANAIAKYFIQHNILHIYKFVGIGLVSIYLIWRARTSEKSQLRISKLLKWSNIAYGIIVVLNTATYIFQKNITNF